MASAPLQQQVTDLTKLDADEQTQIKSLQEQMQADSAGALMKKTAATGTAWNTGRDRRRRLPLSWGLTGKCLLH